ncbi:MAG: PA2169 family four-helix-bundle protein [Vicinamibacterales bacterium]
MSEPNVSVVLNHLIETCRDGAKGLLAAAEIVVDPAAKALFADVATERAQFAETLLPYAQRLGGATAGAGSAGASVHRWWMDLRGVLSGHDDSAVLGEVLRGDSVSLLAFKTAVEGVLPMGVRDLVEQQYATIGKEHEQFNALDRKWKHAG